MLVRDERVLTVIRIVAYCCRSEKLHKVLEADEEDAILFVLTVDLLARMQGPLRRLVAPVALPFFATVRVPYLDQSLSG